jgi:hypothetical protein
MTESYLKLWQKHRIVTLINETMQTNILTLKCTQLGCSGELLHLFSKPKFMAGERMQIDYYRCNECGYIDTDVVKPLIVFNHELCTRIL